jgi:steroid 5-alpha reductase family enzyme
MEAARMLKLLVVGCRDVARCWPGTIGATAEHALFMITPDCHAAAAAAVVAFLQVVWVVRWW